MLRVESNYSLLKYNTFGIDAYCDRFLEYDTTDELLSIIQSGELSRSKWMHLGGGSNVLFLNNNYNGTVLHSCIKGIEKVGKENDNIIVQVGAGVVWDEFVSWCVEHHLCGVENLSLIPGEVGAAPVQNIGAYGVEAKNSIHQVEAINIKSGESRVFTPAECEFGYRSSFFKRSGEYIITRVVFALKQEEGYEFNISYGNIRNALTEAGEKPSVASVRKAVVSIRKAKLPDPLEIGSAGSFFKNPVVSTAKASELKREYEDMPIYEAEGGVKIPAGWMIEKCGWKGSTIGRAGVYAKQALVLINSGGADGSEIWSLAQEIIASVKNRFGIELSPEVCLVE